MYSGGDVAAVVCADGVPWSCAWALTTVACESTNDPTRVSPDGLFHGWWQLWIGHFAPGGRFYGRYVLADAYDPVKSTMMAVELYLDGGAAPWPVCGG